jgi:hypothetical protein
LVIGIANGGVIAFVVVVITQIHMNQWLTGLFQSLGDHLGIGISLVDCSCVLFARIVVLVLARDARGAILSENNSRATTRRISQIIQHCTILIITIITTTTTIILLLFVLLLLPETNSVKLRVELQQLIVLRRFQLAFRRFQQLATLHSTIDTRLLSLMTWHRTVEIIVVVIIIRIEIIIIDSKHRLARCAHRERARVGDTLVVGQRKQRGLATAHKHIARSTLPHSAPERLASRLQRLAAPSRHVHTRTLTAPLAQVKARHGRRTA